MAKKVNKDNFFRLISLLISIGLWLYVVYAENPRQEVWIKGIPITYINSQTPEENSLIILDGAISTAAVKISGRRKNILLVKQNNTSAQVDLAGVTKAGKHKIPIKTTFPIDGIDIIDKNPYNISITVDTLVEKTVPVNVISAGEAAGGYVVDSTVASPSGIRIKGAKSIVETIGYAVANINTKGISASSSVQSQVSLVKTDGNSYKGEGILILDSEVTITAAVVKTKEVDIKPLVTSVEGEIQSIELGTVKATIKGEGSVVDAINEIYTKPLEIPHSETPATITLEIDTPENVVCSIGKVEAIITFKNGKPLPGGGEPANEEH